MQNSYKAYEYIATKQYVWSYHNYYSGKRAKLACQTSTSCVFICKILCHNNILTTFGIVLEISGIHDALSCKDIFNASHILSFQ